MDEAIEELRRLAVSAPEPDAALKPYLGKVRARAYTVTDADVDGLKQAGFVDDDIFAATVTIAIEEGLRRLDAALEVLE